MVAVGPAAGRPRSENEQLLDALVAETWDALAGRDPYYAGDRPVEAYPRGDLAEAEAVALQAQDRLTRLELIDTSGMQRTDRLTAHYLRYWLEDEVKGPQRWWTSFGIAPYTLSMMAILPSMVFGKIDVAQEVEGARYLKLVADLGAHVEAHRERLLAQADRGWRLPKAALANVRTTIEGIGKSVVSAVRLGDERGASQALQQAVELQIEAKLVPAFRSLLETLGADYEAGAPDRAGLVHLPGGKEAYRMWMQFHLGFDADPEDLHRIGLAEVERLATDMARVRAKQFGHNGDEASFHERLLADPKAKAASPEDLEATYLRHLDHMAPVFARLFHQGPNAPVRVQRLAPALEAGMTFGYYDEPKQPGEAGTYFYSVNGIADRIQINAAPLIFHELLPGHHNHIARQRENFRLPELRRNCLAFTGFNEGWAEYAAGLAEAEGLYNDPYDLYGWLAHQRFVAQRIVVDTGLNALGWSFDQACAYMSANTLEGPEQVAGEILRYSTDLPGQALCYRLGFLKFRQMRAEAERRLGDRFVAADFHEAILGEGALPLSVLEVSLNDWIEQVEGRATAA